MDGKISRWIDILKMNIQKFARYKDGKIGHLIDIINPITPPPLPNQFFFNNFFLAKIGSISKFLTF